MKVTIKWPHPDFWQGLCVGVAYGVLFCAIANAVVSA